MVGPAALYIPKGFADAGLGGGLICVTIAMALFAFGMARLIASWRHARANDMHGALAAARPRGLSQVAGGVASRRGGAATRRPS